MSEYFYSKPRHYNAQVDFNIFQRCDLLILFKSKRTFISHQRRGTQRHIIISYLFKYHFHMRGRDEDEAPLASRQLGHGFLDHSLNINQWLTLGGAGMLSTSVTDSLLPSPLQHRTCSCTIKVTQCGLMTVMIQDGEVNAVEK